LLSAIEQKRLHFSKSTEANKKLLFGQFFTSEKTAFFMAGLFTDGEGYCRLLDAGAGIGSLSAAFLDRWRQGGFRFRQVEVDAFELDANLIKCLAQMLEKYDYKKSDFSFNIYKEDFIHAAVNSLTGNLFSETLQLYTHAILNPPYKKISSHSAHRAALRRVGIETVNLYSAFVALAVALTAPNGQIVAIIPRSFCNGPYFRPFRSLFVSEMALQAFYLFNCRSMTQPVWRLPLLGNPWVWLGVVSMALLQLGFTYLPAMQRVFHTVPLAAADWLPILGVGWAIAFLVSMEKWLLDSFAPRHRRSTT